MRRFILSVGAAIVLGAACVLYPACIPLVDIGEASGGGPAAGGGDAAGVDGAGVDGAGVDGATLDASDGGAACRAASTDGTTGSIIGGPPIPAQDPPGSFTLEAWVNVTTAPAGPGIVVGHVDPDFTAAGSSYGLAVGPDLKPVFAISAGATNVTVIGATPLVIGTWTHLAGVFATGATATLFVDGKQAGQQAAAFAAAQALPLGLSIGNSAPFPGNAPLAGRFDEVRLSKVVRYPAAFVPAKLFTSDADTLALYHLDDAAPGAGGPPLTPDVSANANAGICLAVIFVNDCPK